MRPASNAVFYTVAGGVLCMLTVLLATCAPEPSAPAVTLALPQIAGGGPRVAVARANEPIELGIANPAGLAFSPRVGMLLVVTRKPGTPPGPVTDIELITLAGDRAGTVRIAAAVSDPVNLAFDINANRLLIFQSTSNELLEIRARPDGRLDPQTLTRIDARNFGVRNPQGLTIDPVSGRLFILDADGPRIVTATPHLRLGFERAIVSHIDLSHTGWSNLRGLAFDPSNGHLHVLDPAARALHELTGAGQIVATRALAEVKFGDTQGMTFGPSRDATDDPSEMSLYIADRGVGSSTAASARGSLAERGYIIELSLVQPAVEPAAALVAVAVGSLVQTIDMSRFSPPSPDASGIAYASHLGRLVIVDGEVEEMSIYSGANVFEVSLAGSLTRTWTTVGAFSIEPVGAAWNPANRHLFISDDDAREVFEVDPGPDGRYGTSDDRVTHFDTVVFGSDDPEGIAYDFVQGALFIADGVNAQVYRVSPGANGVFDGVSPAGDDRVTSFDTQVHGLLDPEGIAYDSDFGHLYVVGDPDTRVFHMTTSGSLLRTIDISAAGARKPAGLEYAPSSQNPGTMNLWIVDRGVDNDSDSRENDGKAYEFSLPSLSGNSNRAPTVAAGPDQTITLPADAMLDGTVSDDGLPNPPGVPTTSWSVDNGPGPVTFLSPNAADTRATFTTAGTYVLRLTANDGELSATDLVQIIVQPVPPAGAATLERRIATGSDDAEEAGGGGMDLASSDIELVFHATANQKVGLRFTNLTIPNGATITRAYIQFAADEKQSEVTTLAVQSQAADNAGTFTSAAGNVSTRPRTAASVGWSPPAWAVTGETGANQRTPDLSAVIQEIVTRSGWASGNALAIIITGTGHRTARAFERKAAGAALLHVEYTIGS